MPNRIFLDTNIVAYLFSEDPEKKSRAVQAAGEDGTCLSLQVMHEFCSYLLKKRKYPHAGVRAAVDLIAEKFPILPLSQYTVRQALDLGQRYRYSYFDSLHLASAIEHRCRFFYSEDMQHGQKLEEGLTILNPFVPA